MKNKFNMCGQKVTLDLSALENVLGIAVRSLHNQMQDELRSIDNEIRNAVVEKTKNNEHEHYRGLCHANTAAPRMAQTAQNLADAIQAYFHVAESVKRDEVNFEK